MAAASLRYSGGAATSARLEQRAGVALGALQVARGAAAATRAGTGSCRRGRDRPSRGSRRRRRRGGPAPRRARRPTRARSVAWANHGRSVGSGTIRGPAASARCASAMQVGAGSLAWTATSAATARTSRGTCAWSAARRMARMREARRGAVAASSIPAPVAIDSSSTRARPRLSASRAAARSMTSIAVGDLLAAARGRGPGRARRRGARRRRRPPASASRRWASPSGWPAVASATPELEQDPGARAGRRRLGQDAAQVAGRRLRRAAARGVAGGVGQPRHRPRVAGRLGRQQVLGHALAAVLAHGEQLGGAAVGAHALGRRHLLEDPRAHDRVREGQRAPRPEDARGDQEVGRRGRRVGVDAGEVGGLRELGGLEHRHRLGEPHGDRGQAAEAHQHGPPDGARAEGLDALRLGGRRRHALLAQRLDELAHEEGDPAGRAPAGGGEVGVRARARGRPRSGARPRRPRAAPGAARARADRRAGARAAARRRPRPPGASPPPARATAPPGAAAGRPGSAGRARRPSARRRR